MAQVNKPYTFGPNTTISSSNVNDNFDTIYDEFNGNITEANLADDAVTENKIADGSVTSAKLASGLVDNGWVALSGTASVSTGYNKGNREYDLTFNTDLSSTLSPGMRLKLSRGTTPPTQCTDLEASSSQYWSKTTPTGITFTDDFTCEAWVKLESYTGSNQTIVGRRSATQGWGFRINATGQVEIFGLNTNADIAQSNQSIPLNRWVHVAATLDMSGSTGTVYIDGVSVPITYTNTAVTALVQTGDLRVGANHTPGDYFDGEISDVRVWSAARTATQIRDNMNQQLVGNETNLVAYFKLNGDGNDSTSNANNLTAQNSATATTVDNPMKSTEYAIVTKVAYSAPNTTVTVFTGTDHNIPNMTLSNPFYSTQKIPYGFPVQTNKWTLSANSPNDRTASLANTNWNSLTDTISVPVGAWKLCFNGHIQVNGSSTTARVLFVTLSSDATNETNPDLTVSVTNDRETATVASSHCTSYSEDFINLSAQITFTMMGRVSNNTSINDAQVQGAAAQPTVIKAVCAYL